jgi:hypothetical protein
MGIAAGVVAFFAISAVLGLIGLGISNAMTKSASAAARGISRQISGALVRPPAARTYHTRVRPTDLREALLGWLPANPHPSVDNAVYLSTTSPGALVYTYGNVMERSFTVTIRLEPDHAGAKASFAIGGRTEWAGHVQHVREMNDFASAFDACIRHIDPAADAQISRA